MPTLKMGSTTVLTESSGAITVNASNPTVALGSNATFPDGICTGMGFITRELTSGSSSGGTLGGTGLQICPLTNIRDGHTGSNWTNPVLTLSSNLFTLSTGIYFWQFSRTSHQTGHVWTQGMTRYGDSAGNGSSHSDVTTQGVSMGATITYTSTSVSCGSHHQNSGMLEVTSTSQKHAITLFGDSDSTMGSGAFGTLASTKTLIQAMLSLLKLG